MKTALIRLALLVVFITVGTWLVTGANRGWTKTSVPVKTLDPVTGIEGVSYQKKFLPGVDFLGAGIVVAVVLGGSSLLVRKKQPINQPITTSKTEL
jgi:hypothetical protein